MSRTLVSLLLASCLGPLLTRAADASVGVEGHRLGVTLHVSKLGENSDGRSWNTAFRPLQAALRAVPDAPGGHRILIRPDTYDETTLYPAHKGAPWRPLPLGDAAPSYFIARDSFSTWA